VWDNLGVDVTVPLPVQTQVGEGDERHRVMRTFGPWQPWAPVRVEPGTTLGEASPLFVKIDVEVVAQELARLGASA
jgi:hypothetical protein